MWLKSDTASDCYHLLVCNRVPLSDLFIGSPSLKASIYLWYFKDLRRQISIGGNFRL